jgi:integrase
VRGSVTSKCTQCHRRVDGRCKNASARTKGCLRWYYVLDAPDRADGNRKRVWSSGYRTEKDASEALTADLARRNQGIIVNPEKVTLAEFAGRWLEHMATLGRDERTLERYEDLLRLHVLPTLGGLQLRQLEPIHLSNLYSQLLRCGRKDGRLGGLALRTVGHVHRAVHRMLKQAARWQLVARNVASDLELPSVPKSEMATLTRQQATAMLQAAEAAAGRPWLYPLVLLGVATGARLGELLALTWADVDLDTGTLRIGRSRRVIRRRVQVKDPKTEAGKRPVALGPSTIAALRRLRAEQAQRRLLLGTGYDSESDLVICKPDGRPYRPDSTSAQFRRFVDAIGLPRSVHIHTLRHSAASFLAAAGAHPSDIAAQLGHADGGALAMRVYVHPLREGLERNAAHLERVVSGEG